MFVPINSATWNNSELSGQVGLLEVVEVVVEVEKAGVVVLDDR